MEWVADYPQGLDAFLGARDFSRAAAQRLIRAGAVTVNGDVIKKPAHPVADGDVVVLNEDGEVTTAAEPSVRPVDLRLSVLFEDAACLVINKPAGFAVHPAAAEKDTTILHGVAHLFAERLLPFSPGFILVHRLDKETTGCLLIAKDEASYMALQRQFKNRTVEKTYFAIVAGVPDPPAATVDAPVGRNLTDRTRMSVLRTGVSREARTTYRTLSATTEAALLRCDLHTGRTHQIRVHLRAIGYPILGDTTYGSTQADRLAKQYGIESLCLHAWRLRFELPAGGTVINVEAPLPTAFQNALNNVGLYFMA